MFIPNCGKLQADLAELRKQLLASGKTIGFVSRETEVGLSVACLCLMLMCSVFEVKMDKFLKKQMP